jgi:GNAT superfamily N-acetyltransferase
VRDLDRPGAEDASNQTRTRETLTADPLLIRRYESPDKHAIRRLHDDALNEVGAHLGRGPWDGDLDDVQTVYLEPGGEFLVGVLDGEIVAMGALMRVSPGVAEVKRMRVRPGLQGRGYGQTLLDTLHDRAAELGYSTLRLDTTVQQRAARYLYIKNGYSETGRGRLGPFDCVFYERRAVV